MKLTFPKKEKLKNKKVIDRLFVEGKSVAAFPVKMLYVKTELSVDVPFQVGVTVPKKRFKSAVKRNKIKRLLREAYRLNKHSVTVNSTHSYALLFIYIGNSVPTFDAVEKATIKTLNKFNKTVLT